MWSTSASWPTSVNRSLSVCGSGGSSPCGNADAASRSTSGVACEPNAVARDAASDRLLRRTADRLDQVSPLGDRGCELHRVARVRRRELRLDLGLLREPREQVGDRRLDEELLVAEPLAAPAQDPVDLEARDPDAEVAALVGDDLRQLLGAAADREEPGVEPALGEVAPEVAVGVEHVHGRVRDRIRDPAVRVGLDHTAADAPEEQPLRVDRPLQLLGDRRDRLALDLVRLEAGEGGEPLRPRSR